MPESLNPCTDCAEALELDQIALVALAPANRPGHDHAEVAIIACDRHLRRVVLALELLIATEQAGGTLPGLVDIVYRDHLIVEPDRGTPPTRRQP